MIIKFKRTAFTILEICSKILLPGKYYIIFLKKKVIKLHFLTHQLKTVSWLKTVNICIQYRYYWIFNNVVIICAKYSFW